MILSKITAETANGYMAVFRDLNTKKCITACGNIPKVPNGTNIDVTLNGTLIMGYRLRFTDRNKKIFEKKNINIEEFEKKMEIHQSTGVLWRDIKGVENPYDYFDFAKADAMFKQTGHSADERYRINAISREIVEYFRGLREWEYSVLDYLEAFRKVEKKGSFEGFSTHDILAYLADDEHFEMRKGLLTDAEIRSAMQFIKGDIEKRSRGFSWSLLTDEEIESYLSGSEVTLSEEQKEAVRMLNTNKPVIVTGGAGTGKTTTIKAIIDCYAQYYGKDHIILLAPTGKAARRITESIKMEFVAKTIHCALRKSISDEFIFYNETNRLPQRLIVVDESSMIDTLLMRDLLQAIDEGAKVYFIGDCNQLYPVGVGEPFFEFLQNNMCDVVRLSRNFRQGEGTILTNAENVLADKEMIAGKDFEILHIAKDDVTKYVDADVQNISPYNELNNLINNYIHTANMDENLAKRLQEYNDYDPRKKYYIGEKVIAGINTDDYCNGDIGIVNDVNEKGVEVIFESASPDKQALPVFIDRKHMKNITLANAITVHKMQGSECADLRIFLPEKRNSFITKRMVYTAITRAKKRIQLYFYSEPNADLKEYASSV